MSPISPSARPRCNPWLWFVMMLSTTPANMWQHWYEMADMRKAVLLMNLARLQAALGKFTML